jgi:hypothetical protein
MFERITFETKKISFSSTLSYVNQLLDIPGKIISVKPCVPDRTDTKQWVEVYYERLMYEEN